MYVYCKSSYILKSKHLWNKKLTVYSAYYKLFLKMLGSKRLANVAEKRLSVKLHFDSFLLTGRASLGHLIFLRSILLDELGLQCTNITVNFQINYKIVGSQTHQYLHPSSTLYHSCRCNIPSFKLF